MILKVNGDLGASIWNKKMVYSKYLPSLVFMDVVIYLVGFCITNLRIDVQKNMFWVPILIRFWPCNNAMLPFWHYSSKYWQIKGTAETKELYSYAIIIDVPNNYKVQFYLKYRDCKGWLSYYNRFVDRRVYIKTTPPYFIPKKPHS